MSTYTVNVSGIASTTNESHLHDFFTFCGKITKIDFKDQNATIHFEKPSAAKTALMLNGGTLDGATLSVTSDTVHEDADNHDDGSGGIDQTDKPRAGIAAEYLAKGYVLQDSILHRAIEMDKSRGISKRFLSYIQSLDSSLGSRALGPDKTISGKVQEHLNAGVQQAKTLDEQKGYSKTANDYYSKAISSPVGQRVLAFYTTTSKQVLDIHEEARRIAAQQKAAGDASASAPTPEKAAEPEKPAA